MTEAIADNFVKNKKENIADSIADTVADLVEPIRMNPDGTSFYNIRPILSSAKDTSYASFKKNDMLKLIPYYDSEFLDMKRTAAVVGDDHVFNFLFDWRLSGDDVADELLEYIEDVMELTGHSKVSLYCLSQGSVPVAQYVYKYAGRGYIDNLVFNNPIFNGSEFVTKILDTDEQYTLSFEEIISLVEAIDKQSLNIVPINIIDGNAANSNGF